MHRKEQTRNLAFDSFKEFHILKGHGSNSQYFSELTRLTRWRCPILCSSYYRYNFNKVRVSFGLKNIKSNMICDGNMKLKVDILLTEENNILKLTTETGKKIEI